MGVNVNMKRIYEDKINIDLNSIKEFYKNRAITKVNIDIDSPVVLCGDKNKDNIKEWTDFEVKNRLDLLQLTKNEDVLEVGCGTGRISKYIIEKSRSYIGIDCVSELIEIAKKRKDILKNKEVKFIEISFEDIFDNYKKISPENKKFNRFVISGGVLMYMNDDEVSFCLNRLNELLDDKCIIYISEPIAMKKRLTLNKFYSGDLDAEYSAIYRTEEEYMMFFENFYRNNFKLEVNEEFFFNDIKLQKETKQWLFVLSR